MAGRRQDRWAHFVEDEGQDDLGSLYLGTFSGHVEGKTRMLEQVEGLTADEAIAWGRERAVVVLLRLADGDEHFSAGDENPRREREWPPPEPEPVARRRPPGQEWRERTAADAPVAWAVDLVVHVPADTPVAARAEAMGARARRGRLSDRRRLPFWVERVSGEAPGFDALTRVPHVVELDDVEAPTAHLAARRAAERLAAPADWAVTAHVLPLEQRPERVRADRWHVETGLGLPARFARRLAAALRTQLDGDPRFSDVRVHTARGALDVAAIVAAPDDGEAEVLAEAALDAAFETVFATDDEELGWTRTGWDVAPAAPGP